MYWPTLRSLKDLGGSGTIQEIDDKVIRLAGYSEDQQSVLHKRGPQTEISYRLAWVRTHLKMIKAIENSSRGVWAISDRGRSLRELDMASIPSQLRLPTPSLTTTISQGIFAEDSLIPQDTSATTPEPFSSTEPVKWTSKLLDTLQSLAPDAFERLCQRILRESGFTRVDVTGRSGDGGIDGVGVLRVSLLNFQVFFQCKRYSGSVGSSSIRDFRGAMVGRSDKGLLITTGGFTADARREATRDGAPVLDLIDGERLCELLKNLKLGVDTRQVEEVTINSSWFNEL